MGHGLGVHAPGVKKPEVGAYKVAHNLIKAHSKVWHTYDKKYRSKQRGEHCIRGACIEVGEELGAHQNPLLQTNLNCTEENVTDHRDLF